MILLALFNGCLLSFKSFLFKPISLTCLIVSSANGLSMGYSLNKAEVGDFVVGVERSGLPLTTGQKCNRGNDGG